MAQADDVAVTVNGRRATLDGEAGSLLHALRGQLGLTGARAGCGVGECGACTVWVDGAPTRSCTLPLSSVAGSAVTTPEGLGGPDDPHPVQRAFIDAEAAQCGYCVNGMIMTVAALARDGEPVGRQQLTAALDEHICRCGTHARLVQAAALAVGADTDRTAGPEGPAGVCDAASTCAVVRGAPLDDGEATPAVTALPGELASAPDVGQWFALLDDGRVQLRSGRSEIGQGVHVALGQIAAAHLGVPADRVVVGHAATGHSPDEGVTAGSRSMAHGGVAVAMAATALRRVLLARAAAHLGVAAAELSVDGVGGRVRHPSGAGVGLDELAALGPVTGEVGLADQPAWDGPALGRSAARGDLAVKLTGAPAFVHDLQLPGMLHARAVLPPTDDAELAEADVDAVRRRDGVVEVVADGGVLVVIAATESRAEAGAGDLAQRTRWRAAPLAWAASDVDTLRALPGEPHVARADADVDRAMSAGRTLAASYTKPYQAHASVAPSCAVARWDDDGLTVWSHTQGVYPLRQELAALLGVGVRRVAVTHGDGPGCYGHNAADDAAGYAAMAARAVPGRPVRVQLSAADELRGEPYGSAMAGDVEAALDAEGGIRAWRHRGVTDTHVARPRGQGDRLAVAWWRGGGVARPWTGPHAGGSRNVVPIYDVDVVDAAVDNVVGPLRTGSLRSLGSFANIFAIESFIDELAEAAGADPLAFRLAHVRDPRAREVLQRVAERVGWADHVGPSGRGQGLALLRYHDTMAYAAVAVDVAVGADRIETERITIAADAGSVINAQGLRQQLEGGALQGLSRTTHERLAIGRDGVGSRDWSSYPVLGFADVPPLDVIIVDRPGAPPLGAGEVTTPPVPAALANAVDDACGIRLRDLPITGAAVQARLLAMDDAELARVRLE